MKRPTNRRTVLAAAAIAAVAATGGTAVAQSPDLRGAVTFADGKAIPEGEIEIYVEDPSVQESAQRRVAEMHVNSDGASKAIDFSLSQPTSAAGSPPLQIVARLTRADGWLIARGSVQASANAPANITLKQVMY
jgi:hypothetical protein